MNKTAIKNFAIWARNKLIADITYKAGLLGITDKQINEALPSSTQDVLFFDIGTTEPYAITGEAIAQRRKLVELITQKAKQSNYATAYKAVVEEVAYTWFNRLIAVRFMEVNEYLPSRIRVLSSESDTKIEPDLVTTPLDVGFEYTPYEKDQIIQLKNDNKLDELFRMLFIKQCNALNDILPELFETTSDYTELLFNINFTDKDGVVYRLVHDIPEDDFNVSKEGQVEIIGWLYQYYNTDPKANVDAYVKKGVKVSKQDLPAKTQLFTPDWIVRYMVENSLGRLWMEGHPNDNLKDTWQYYLDEAEQEADVQKQLDAIREGYQTIKPQDIKVIDPCMGSGHILVYVFDVLIQIYESYGYSQRDAAKNILDHNLYGLDIDNRAYQLAYFAVMMKARQYNRRILNGENTCQVYAIQESNSINRNQLKYFGAGMEKIEKNTALLQIQGLLDTFIDAKEYGSILNVDNYDWGLLRRFASKLDTNGQMGFDAIGIEGAKNQLQALIDIGAVMVEKYDVAVTNPPYINFRDMNPRLLKYCTDNFENSKSDLFGVFIEKCHDMCANKGMYSLITMQNWMYQDSFERFREKIIRNREFVNLLHLGMKAFESGDVGTIVKTVAFVFRKILLKGKKATFVNLRDNDSSGSKREEFVKIVVGDNESLRNVHYSIQNIFLKIPHIPIAYAFNDRVIKSYEDGSFINSFGNALCGIQTGNNDLFLRLWFEVDINNFAFDIKTNDEYIKSGKKWAPQIKGGLFRKWYGNFDYIINMKNKGYDISHAKGTNFRLRDSRNYFREGLTWSHTSDRFGVRFLPAGNLCNVEAPTYFLNFNGNKFKILAFLNTKVAEWVLAQLDDSLHFSVTPILCLPFIETEFNEELVKRNIEISKEDWDSYEVSWEFKRHPLVRKASKIADAFAEWQEECLKRFNQVRENEEIINNIFINAYRLQNILTSNIEDKNVSINKADKLQDIKSLISYAVGCMFGRYSLDLEGLAYAGGEWDESKYSTFIPDPDNVIPITDEEYFEDDIVGLFCAFVKAVYGADTLEENLDFIADALGNRGKTSREVIRNYFLKDFFKDHCKTYKKRPIYWLFDSGKGNGFKALVYLHRYNEDTIGDLRIDYLHRMQRVYESEIARMQETINNSTNAREVTAAEKRKEKLIKQLKETKDYDEKIAHLAHARIAIDLDDGVKVNYEKVQTGTDGKKLAVLAKI